MKTALSQGETIRSDRRYSASTGAESRHDLSIFSHSAFLLWTSIDDQVSGRRQESVRPPLAWSEYLQLQTRTRAIRYCLGWPLSTTGGNRCPPQGCCRTRAIEAATGERCSQPIWRAVRRQQTACTKHQSI